ncbi:4-O-dimethylallyl-L-tyrosine synthase [Mycena venus]|uniref:4-O-dimethylallyl-L-tyrosine synthase n=1 Tax=Mycena venus TaxID=2733690 RepID=A0A8H6YP68_9AGAR|nr:4-O-dimethylallyl-L-tyrosine synthase [Mycena venus]
MAAHKIDHAALWANPKYFAQVPLAGKITPPPETSSVQEQVISVAKQLLGDSYKLNEEIVAVPKGDGFEVYNILTQLLPVLSEQSKWYWEKAANSLASMLESAKYPIHSQTSHLIFWWARLGGINGPTVKGTTKEEITECTRDGACTEFSWVVPRDTDPTSPCNRKIRFAIDPFHPDTKTRLAGGATSDYLWSDVGGMGLDTIEKWLFPNLETNEQVVPGCTYFIGFDLNPNGSITLKHYFMPPAPDPNVDPVFKGTVNRLTSDLSPWKGVCETLHPTLLEPLAFVMDYLSNEGKDSGMMFAMMAFDSCPVEKNRLKLYLWTPKHTIKDIVGNMTMGGKLKGPKVDAAMDDLRKLCKHLFPYATDEKVELKNQHVIDDVPDAYAEGDPGRHDCGLLYYYELFAGEPLPFPKVYFLMDFFGKDDLSTAKGVEAYLTEVGKPGEKGWFVNDLVRANPHRAKDWGTRTGTATALAFGLTPSGCDLTGYYSSEVFRR